MKNILTDEQLMTAVRALSDKIHASPHEWKNVHEICQAIRISHHALQTRVAALEEQVEAQRVLLETTYELFIPTTGTDERFIERLGEYLAISGQPDGKEA